MTEIYLIRHAQAEGNLYRVMQGQWNGGVTPLGITQIDALAKRFESVSVDAVYSSDLYRAVLTAGAITRTHPLPIVRLKELREIDIGPWETRFFGDLKHEHPDEISAFMTDAENWSIPGAESYSDVRRRGTGALRKIAEENPGRTVCVVSHGITLRGILSGITGVSLNDIKALPMLWNTAVTRVVYDNGRFSLDYINDYSHLDGLTPSWPRIGELRAEYIDPAREKDYYTRCYADAWRAAHGSLVDFSARVYLKCAEEHYRNDRHSVIKLLEGDEPVGLVDMDAERGRAEGVGWLSLLYLREDHRGRGYGAQALARAIFRYRALGREVLRLQCAEDNTAAMRFYERNGFAAVSSAETRLGKLLLLEKSLKEVPDV